jgi:hypothetical protein
MALSNIFVLLVKNMVLDTAYDSHWSLRKLFFYAVLVIGFASPSHFSFILTKPIVDNNKNVCKKELTRPKKTT